MNCCIKHCPEPAKFQVKYDEDDKVVICETHLESTDENGIQYFKRFAQQIIPLEMVA